MNVEAKYGPNSCTVVDVEIFHRLCWWRYRKHQRITKFIKTHHLGNMNDTTFFVSPLNICWDISQLTDMNDRKCHSSQFNI